MKVIVPKETKDRENRVALSPTFVKKLVALGFSCAVQAGAGLNSAMSDQEYIDAGAAIENDVKSLYSTADVVLKINPPSPEEISWMQPGAKLLSFLYTSNETEIVDALCQYKIDSFSINLIPRISRAQKMDALSSQANLAGYKAVILGAAAMGKIFPMLMTSAGTIKPAKVVIFGAGVAGLQAIATAKRLGAIVEVTDIRPETKEQIESLGGKFIDVGIDDSVKMEGGYVKGVSAEFLAKQREIVSKKVAEADLVITTALIPGRKAPLLIDDEMLSKMKLGAVIVDMAVEQGGNCANSKVNETVIINGVKIIGEANLPSTLALNASELYAKNIFEFLTHLADNTGFKWEMDEEITIGSLVTKEGKKVQPTIK